MEVKEVREVRCRFRQAVLEAGSDPAVEERDLWEIVFKMLTGTGCYADIRSNGVIAFVVSLKDQGPLMGWMQQMTQFVETQQASTISGKNGKTHPPQDVAASSEHGDQHGRAA